MKKIFYFIVLIISVIIINNLVRSIYTLWQKSDLVVEAERELAVQKEENERLKSQLSHVESREFVEEVARNKLLLAKPGEQGVIISKNIIGADSTPSAKVEKETENWEKWLRLFF